jgi:hypothetical protein
LELPVVRETALKNLVNALFDAAKDSNGNLSLKELISLFEDARKASLEEDVLINPLKTESFEAISAMIKTVASKLEDSIRDQVLEELDREGWLHQNTPQTGSKWQTEKSKA